MQRQSLLCIVCSYARHAPAQLRACALVSRAPLQQLFIYCPLRAPDLCSTGRQFDDPEEDSTGKTFGGTARDKDLISDSKPASEVDEDWQEKWFSHEDRKYDDEGGEVKKDEGAVRS